jgi:hypothetical protein
VLKDLGFPLQAAKCARMNDAVAIALKVVSIGVRRLRESAATQLLRTKAESAQHGPNTT